MQLAAWLISLAWPIVKRVLLALGIGVVSYEGLALLAGQMESAVRATWGGLGGPILDIATLGGFPLAVGIVIGAFNARLAFLVLKKLAFLS